MKKATIIIVTIITLAALAAGVYFLFFHNKNNGAKGDAPRDLTINTYLNSVDNRLTKSF